MSRITLHSSGSTGATNVGSNWLMFSIERQSWPGTGEPAGNLAGLGIVFIGSAWCPGQLGVKRLTILQTAAEKLRPGRHGDVRFDFLGEEAPKLRMVPAKVLFGTVAMRPDARAQFLHFGHELFT
jgi:hypothetical protein